MYVNTSVEIEIFSKSEQERLLELYRFVGYTALALNFSYSPSKNYRELLADIQPPKGIELFGKITIVPNSQNALKNALKTLKSYHDFLISVESKDKEVLTFAINDSRVDTISCSQILDLQSITPGLVSLINTNKKHLEISLKDIIIANPHERSKLFHEMSKFLSIISSKHPLILYGGTEKSFYEIRGPQELIAIFIAIFDLSSTSSKAIVKSNPESVLSAIEERKKLPNLPNGVKITSIGNKEC